MSFAQEIKDFLDAYDTVSTVMTNNARTRILDRQANTDDRYKEALTRKIDYEIGAEGRESDAIIDSIDDPMAPYRTSNASGGGGGGGDTVAVRGGSNTEMAMNYFVDRGLSPIQASGLVGNLMAESGQNLNTGAVGDDGTAIGIMQARLDRRTALENAVPDWQTNLNGQLDFIWSELQGPENATLRRLMAATTPEEAAAAGIGYERPAGYSDGNPQGGHNFSGRLAYTQGLAQQYASLSPEGQVAELAEDAGAPLVPEDFAVPEGGDVDDMTGPGGPQTHDPYGKDDLLAGAATGGTDQVFGTGDVDYLENLENAGVTPTDLAQTVIEQPITDIEAVPTPAPTSPQGDIPQGDAEAIPEEPRAMATAGGIDPLPQTSGHMGAVARTGEPDAPNAVRAALNEPDPEPRGFIRDVIRFGKQMLGIEDEGIETDPNNPLVAANDDGVGGAPLDLVERIEQKVDPNRTLTNEARMLKVMSVIWNFKMRQGKPSEAWGSAYSIYQTYKVMRNQSLELAKVAAEEATTPEELAQAVEMFTEAYSLVPDGEVISATPNEDGTFTIQVKDAQTQEIKSENLVVDAKAIVSEIMNITPDQFDALVEKPILGGEPEAPDVLPGAIEEMYPDEETGVVPTPDVGINETPSPMGVTVPSDQAQGPGIYEEEGIQVASADPNAPAGDPTTTPLPKSVVTRPEPGAVAPPMTPKEFAKFILPYREDEKAVGVLTALWEQDNKLYDEYLKSLPTEAEVDALAAYNRYFEEVRSTPNDQFFDTSQSSIAAIGDEKLMGIAQRIADARNEEYKRILEQRVAETNEAEEITSRRTAQTVIDAIPTTQTEWYSPDRTIQRGAQDYSDRGTMYSGAPGEAEQSQVSGRVPVRAPDYGLPTGIDMDIVNAEDYGRIERAVGQADANADAWNKAGFEGTAAPAPSESEEGVRQRLETAYTQHLAALQNPERTPDAESQQYFTWLADKVNRNGMGSDVMQSARDLLSMPTVPGIARPSETRAVEIAYELLMFDKNNPTETLYDAERYTPGGNVPAGLVKVTNLVDPKSPFLIPEATFLMMDERRQILADTYIQEQTITQRQENESRASSNRQRVMGAKNTGEYGRVPPPGMAGEQPYEDPLGGPPIYEDPLDQPLPPEIEQLRR